MERYLILDTGFFSYRQGREAQVLDFLASRADDLNDSLEWEEVGTLALVLRRRIIEQTQKFIAA